MKGFGKILGTNHNCGKWWDTAGVMLPGVNSQEIKLDNILSVRIFEWLVILVGCMI